MTIIYLVGPSGSGKSALCKELAGMDSRFVHFSLDEEVKRRMPEFDLERDGWHIRWNVCRQALDKLDQIADPEKVYLVDSGAGALSRQYGREYFIERADRTICLNGDPIIIYRRNAEKFLRKRNVPRPFEHFYAEEYSEKRREVYGAACITIDTTSGNENDSLAALKAGIESIVVEQQTEHCEDTDPNRME